MKNIGIGMFSFCQMCVACDSLFIGVRAGAAKGCVRCVTAIGDAAYQSPTCYNTGSTYIGFSAGRYAYCNKGSMSIGFRSACYACRGCCNLGIGSQALAQVGRCTSYYSTLNWAVGGYSGAYYASTSGEVGGSVYTMCRSHESGFIGYAATGASNSGICNGIGIGAYATAASCLIRIGNSCTTSQYICGSLSKTSGSFSIKHPNPAKKNMELSHSFAESPNEGDNLYRYKVDVKNCCYSMKLPSYYKHLNKCNMAWVYPNNHFGNGYARIDIEKNTLNITTETDGCYNILLMGTRCDPIATKNWKGVVIDG